MDVNRNFTAPSLQSINIKFILQEAPPQKKINTKTYNGQFRIFRFWEIPLYVTGGQRSNLHGHRYRRDDPLLRPAGSTM